MLQARARVRSRFVPTLALLVPVLAVAGSACSDTYNSINNSYYTLPGAGGGGGEPSTPASGGDAPAAAGQGGVEQGGAAAGAGAGGEGGDDGHAEYPDAPWANVSVAEQGLDPFGVIGTRFYFGVSQEQVDLMNQGVNGGPIGIPPNGDIYSPGGSDSTYADHLWITTAGPDGKTAHYGKVKTRVVGQSTMRPWTKQSIPNLNVDSNEFVKSQLFGNFEHLRLNNAQVGNIFREYLTTKLYRDLGYPAPLASYAWVSSNIWGKDVQIPEVLVERYKYRFCERGDAFGGSCKNIWEFVGDFGGFGGGIPGPKGGGGASIFDDPNNCQVSSCDSTHIKELEQLLQNTPPGDGFKAATADYIDWPSFHKFQCLSWVLATGDDAIHSGNNTVIAERADGKFVYLPYSIDISLGQEWYPVVTLAGSTSIARGCQADKSCWADTISACEGVIADFTKLDPVGMLKAQYKMLQDEGMIRNGDAGRYDQLVAWFQDRLKQLPDELEANRAGPSICPKGQQDCGGWCADPGMCGGPICKPPVGKVPPEMGMMAMGVGGAPDGAGGADGGPILDPGPPGAAGAGPVACGMIMNYGVAP